MGLSSIFTPYQSQQLIKRLQLPLSIRLNLTKALSILFTLNYSKTITGTYQMSIYVYLYIKKTKYC